MPKKIEKLVENPWLELHKMVYPEKDISGYVYSHEKACDGKKVAILPFMYLEGNIFYLLRHEVTPCWHPTKQIISSITGGYEKEKGIEGTVIMELKEEAGYTVNKEELIDLGTCRGTKSTDTIYHLYSVDLTNKKQGMATGDGSELERKAECKWAMELFDCEDPIAFTCYYKLNKVFVDKIYNK